MCLAGNLKRERIEMEGFVLYKNASERAFIRFSRIQSRMRFVNRKI